MVQILVEKVNYHRLDNTRFITGYHKVFTLNDENLCCRGLDIIKCFNVKEVQEETESYKRFAPFSGEEGL